jgi:WD40 repeat protein
MTVATETSDRQRIELWNPPAAKELWTWTMPADCREHFQEVHFVPGGKYILARMAGRTDIKEGLFVLDAKSGKQLAGIRGFGLAGFSPDGRFIAYHVRLGTPAPDGMRVYCEVRDLQSGETTALKLESPSHPHYTWGSEACFSADSKIFAYASGDSIEFYDLQSKQRLGPPRPHSADFLEMAFAPSGSILAAHYNDSTVILWDAQAPSR